MTAIKALSNSHWGKQRKVPTGRSSKRTRLCPLTRTPFAPLSHKTQVSPPSATEQTNPSLIPFTRGENKSGPQQPTPHGNWLPRPTKQDYYAGGDLLSHTLPSAVPSALVDLASGFGMGPGVTPPLTPPTKTRQQPTPPQNFGWVVSCQTLNSRREQKP